MTGRLADRASARLAARTSRRGFLARGAIAGSALAVNPVRYVLRPGTAYAALCGCANKTCDCGSKCCDGYTEFCCTLTGLNACPSGTFPAGWWKADGSNLCGPAQPRYYIDCNVLPGENPCTCGCASGKCTNRRACCNVFRYGQCHQEVAGTTAIMCRVVTCQPPWEFDGTCTTAALTDNATAFHDAPCLHPPAAVHGYPATYRAGMWRFKSVLGSGKAVGFPYGGGTTDVPVVGDWNGDGTKTIAIYRDGYWFLRNTNTGGLPELIFPFGISGDVPVAGDWNGDGYAGVGVWRNGDWYLRNSLTGGPPDAVFPFGQPGDVPVVGDWNGDGVDGIGVFRAGTWYLRNSLSAGEADAVFSFGRAGDIPVVGDWNANGIDTIGVWRDGTWKLRNSNTTGTATINFVFGKPGDIPLAWAKP